MSVVWLRPKTLRGSVAAYAFALSAALLLVAFAAIDVLVGRDLEAELERTASLEIEWLLKFMADHERGPRDFLLDEAREHLGTRSGVLIQIEESGRPFFASREIGSARLPESSQLLTNDQGRAFRVASSTYRSFLLTVAVPRTGFDGARSTLRQVMAICFAFGLLASSLLARAVATRATNPLAEVAAAAERVHGQNLTERLRFRPRYEEVERLAASFNRMLERLETAIEEVRRFTADASHELRTPLTVLKSQVQTALLSEEHRADVGALLTSQLEEVERLRVMIDDLLLLSRAEAGPVTGELVDFTDVVIESVEKLRGLFDAKGIELATGALDATRVRGESGPLARVVTNLLDNALKYTDSGGRVSVDLTRADGLARLEIADTGRGIATAAVARIFDRFYRADPSRSRESGGAGLGLAIVSRIVSAHGGAVSVKSKLAEGSAFTVELPAA